MSDAVDDFGFYAEQLLNKSKTNPLRERMQQFISEHGGEADLKQVRMDVEGGENLSEIVIEDREERP